MNDNGPSQDLSSLLDFRPAPVFFAPLPFAAPGTQISFCPPRFLTDLPPPPASPTLLSLGLRVNT